MLRTILQHCSRWGLVVALAAVVFVAGYAGFREYYRVTGKERTVADIAYVTLQLFVFQGGDLDEPINFRLQFARFAAPVTAAYAGFYALLSVFYYQVQLVRPWLTGNHVIVCGLGRKGYKLVAQLRARGECVVVIENNDNNDGLTHCRQLGAIVLVGAANDRWMLERACVHRARALISIVGDDGVNVETAVLAHELNQKRASGALECVVHVFDPRLQQVLKRHRIFTDTEDPFELRFFNAFELGAQAMLRFHPIAELPSSGQPHLLIVGLGRLGESLLVQAAADWRARRTAPGDKLLVTAVDRQALAKDDWLRLRYPDLADACQLQFLEMDVHFPDLPGRALVCGEAAPPVSIAYVCVDNDSLALFAALALHECLNARDVPIVVRMSEEAGLAALMGSRGDDHGLIDGVHAVGLLDIACSLDLLLAKTPPAAPPRTPA